MMLGDLGKGEFHLSPPPSSSSAASPSSSSQYNPMVVPQKSRRDGGGGDHEGGHGSGGGEKEHMFDKVVTPSDVGKLNRLVIPKHYAEKYFPVDWTVNEKGLLLNFEDRVGKPWRFRYSYWNSSQSYVMTKGWSRFVKEKKLDAGDVVSFQRGVGELGKDHFYIDWKHRLSELDALGRSVPFGRLFVPPASLPYLHSLQQQNSSIINYGACGYNVAANHGSAPLFYNLRSGGSAQVGSGGDHESVASPMAIDGVRAVHGNATGKRLRLFGVNMECSTGTIPGDDDDNNGVGNLFPPAGMRITRPLTMLPSPPSHPPVKLMLFNGVPLPAVPSQLSRKGKQPLSLDLGI